MSTELENVPVVSTRLLEGSLVAPAQFGGPVSNHLTETKIFPVAQEKSTIKTKPPVINFEGYTVGKLHQQTLHIINTSGDNVGIHIIPPTTQYFTISYKKTRSQLVPGLSLDVTVSFRPSEYKYYFDSIRLHSKDNDNLLIPIHAYPVLNTSSFPRSVSFPPIPVGQTHSHTISFSNPIPVDFEYQLNVLQQHSSFSISSMRGIIPANGKANIVVKFAPMEYSTAIMKLQLIISQFNFQPTTCTFVGNATPGLALEQYKDEQRKRKAVSKQQTSQKPSFSRKPKPSPTSKTSSKPVSNAVEYEGLQFPLNLNTPSAVGKVLTQNPGVQNASQLRTSIVSSNGTKASYQLKETIFLQRVKEIDEEEKANKLRWVRHLGSDLISNEEEEQIIKARIQSENTYKLKCCVANDDEEFTRMTTELSKKKTRRKLNELPQAIPSFDMQSNNPWLKRYRALQRFVQAGRKVLMQVRIQRKLEMLRTVVQQLKLGKDLSEIEFSGATKKSASFNIEEEVLFSPSLVLPLTLTEYIDLQNAKDDLPTNPFQTKPVTFPANPSVTHLFELQIPKEYVLLDYNQFPTPENYISTESDRSLRIGAEAEYKGLPELEEKEEMEQPAKDKIMPLTIPPELLEVPKEHPFHIFNPCPEVINSLWPLLPNSEVTWEHNLSPLPTGTGAPHPQPKFDPYEGIPELMKWKLFPSPFLASLEGQKTLSSVWRPCLSDPFSKDLIPCMENPVQLKGPQPDDIMSESNDVLPVPTIEMIKAEFYVPEASGPVCTRKESEDKLQQQQKKLNNQVGSQFQQKYSQLLSLLK